MSVLRSSLAPENQPEDRDGDGQENEEKRGYSVEGVDSASEEVSELPESKIGDGNVEETHYVVDHHPLESFFRHFMQETMPYFMSNESFVAEQQEQEPKGGVYDHNHKNLSNVPQKDIIDASIVNFKWSVVVDCSVREGTCEPVGDEAKR